MRFCISSSYWTRKLTLAEYECAKLDSSFIILPNCCFRRGELPRVRLPHQVRGTYNSTRPMYNPNMALEFLHAPDCETTLNSTSHPASC
jgi:hypothetical protein